MIKINNKSGFIKMIIIFLIIELKLISSPLFVNFGNSKFDGQKFYLAQLFYNISKPAIFQSDRINYNIAQTNYFRKNYQVSKTQFLDIINNTAEINLKCDAIIQYVNSDLRLIETELDDGKVEQYKERILVNIGFLEQCIQLDKTNKVAEDNANKLRSILTNKEPTKKQESMQLAPEESKATEDDNKAQHDQREFIENKNNKNNNFLFGPNW